MEFKKIFQSKKSLLSVLAAGPFMILLFLFLIKLAGATNSKIEIYGYSDIDKSVVSSFENVEFKEDADSYIENVSS
jgi:hypothetical protein